MIQVGYLIFDDNWKFIGMLKELIDCRILEEKKP